ncbi:M3 family metallopeptidase [Mycoplasma struthionis]|uniref:M3 family metallopeptidase n=1 Tax=Mycoplasma struthionis TaxID=538220 RepID=UPI0021BD3F3C|nr:M3 family metallopeptidase [Mycoplasma struthionis]
MKKYKSYDQIENKYRFDLEAILENKTLDELKKEFFLLFDKLIEIKDSKYENIENYLKSIELSKQLGIINNKISNYLSNNINTNLVNQKYLVLLAEFEKEVTEKNKLLGSEINRLKKYENKIREYLKDPRLNEVKKDIEASFETLEHKLNDEVEEYLIKSSAADTDLSELFAILTDSEVLYGFVNKNNKKIKITNANIGLLRKDKDEKVRKDAHVNYLKGFIKHKHSLSFMLYNHFKELSVDALIRNFSSTVESFLLADHVDKKLLNILYTQVQNKMPLIKKYYDAYKKFYKARFKKDIRRWDWSYPIFSIKNKYSIEEAKDIVLEALKIMPQEYNNIVKKALNENWVDFISVPSKITGAYSIGESYGLNKKYILMNFDYTLSSVNTLAHEMGHSLHSYFSDTYQPYFRSKYPIFLAEIASIFNELMLNDYLVKNAKSDKEKFMLLNQSIDDFIATVIKQTEWSNYEYDLYEAVDKQMPVNTFEALENIYLNNAKKYSTTNKYNKPNDIATINSVIVPHYYYGFYVYKYAIGYICANVFFNQYKLKGIDGLNEYINKF